jgi:hypothetical protein
VFKRRKDKPVLETAEAEEILRLVFADCGEVQDTIPMEELTSYSLYREESFKLQRSILAAALILFVFVPILFVQPAFRTSFSPKGERGLPVYTIGVDTFLPVKRVTAVLGGVRLPVYEVNSHEYTIEPTKNGAVKLTVELFNGQSVSETLDVTNADVTSPRLLKCVRRGDGYDLYLTDEGVGVDYENIYAVTGSGETVYPESYDRQTGIVSFGEDAAGAQVFIPDYFENILKINL